MVCSQFSGHFMKAYDVFQPAFAEGGIIIARSTDHRIPLERYMAH